MRLDNQEKTLIVGQQLGHSRLETPLCRYARFMKRIPRTGQLAERLATAELGQTRAAPGGVESVREPDRSPNLTGRFRWSGRPGSNRRRPAWEAGILPLNYARLARKSKARYHLLSNPPVADLQPRRITFSPNTPNYTGSNPLEGLAALHVALASARAAQLNSPQISWTPKPPSLA